MLDVLLLCEDARHEVAVIPTTLRLPWARRAEKRKLEAVNQVIAAFGLERFRQHRTAELSTGTRRVVDLASIVLARPRLLLLDEPTAGIAQREAEAFIPLLRRLHQVADTTIVLVEHDVPLVFELCSTVVVMELGRVVAAGPPEVVRADPRALAAYLGASDEASDGLGAGRRGTAGRTATKEGEDGSEHGGFRAPGAVQPPGAVGPVLAAPAPPSPGHAGAHRADRDRHRRRAGGLARPGALGHARAGRAAPARPRWRASPRHARHAGEPGQHEHARCQRHGDQRGVPGRRHQQPGRAGSASPRTRSTTSRRRRSTSTSNQINNGGGINGRKINPMIVQLRPDQRRQHAVAVPAVDPGQPAGLRGGRRHRDLDGRQPALRDPAGAHPAHQRLVHHDQLDADLGSPYLWWTGPGPGARAGRHRAVGPELGPPGPRQEGRRRRLGPGRRPGGAQLLSAARPQEGGHHAPGRRRWPGNPDETATTNSEAQLAVERFKAAGVQSVFPLLPENAFFPYLAAESVAAVLPPAPAERLPVDASRWRSA